jgi:metal-responsive CopG/Arc/MetJ family transcriptional regulator
MALKEDNISVSVSLPREFVEKVLDPDIKKEQRSRSKQIAKIVIDYYEKQNKDCQN